MECLGGFEVVHFCETKVDQDWYVLGGEENIGWSV